VATPDHPRRAARRPRWKRSLEELASAPFSYVWQFHLKSRVAAWALARRIWRLDRSLRVVLAAVVVLSAAAALASRIDAPTEGQRAAIDFIFLALCALAFGICAAALAGWGAISFAAITPWLAYFSVSGTSMLAETPARVLIAFPVWTLAYVGWRLCVADARRARGALIWVAIAGGAGWLTAGLSGFRAVLDLSRATSAVLFAFLLALAGVVAWWWRRGRTNAAPTFGDIAMLTGGMMALVLAVSAIHDRTATISWVSAFFPQLDYLATLFWLWSGGGFALAILKLVDWMTRRALRTGLGRPLVVGAPIAWIAAGIWEWLIARGNGGARSAALAFVAQVHLAVTLSTLGVVTWWRFRGRLTARRVVELNTVWVVAFLALLALASKLAVFDPAAMSAGASELVMGATLAGVFWTLARAEKDWSGTADRRVALYAAWGVTFVAILIADRLDPSWQLSENRAIQVFEGMLTLGLPLAVHARITRRRRGSKRIPVLTHLAWFMLGTLVAFGIMQFNATDPRWLIVAIPIWLCLLLARRAIGASDDRLTVAMAGAMLAAGTTMYWRLPATMSIPFQAAIPSIDVLAGWYEFRRSMTLGTELFVTFGGLPMGALCGWIAATAFPKRKAQT
jgi:hypothetical protein